jgi:hypothetical protein
MSFIDHAECSVPHTTKLPPSVDLAAAQSAVERLTREYPAMANYNLKEIRNKFTNFDCGDSEEMHLELRRFAHNFTGQEASFNYPVISDIGNSLRLYLQEYGEFESLELNVVEAHFDAIEGALDSELSGDVGEEGAAILARLHDLTGTTQS